MLSVDRAVLRDGEQEFPLAEFRSSSDSYYSYNVDLGLAGVQPRFGGAYGFAASGGTFAASVDMEGILLPDALSSAELDQTSRFERGALDLTWTGRGEAPLELSLDVTPQIDDYDGAYHIDCLLADDGAFTLPAALPDGFVTATFRRTRREVVSSGGKSLQTLGEVVVNHRFWLGPASPVCDAEPFEPHIQLVA